MAQQVASFGRGGDKLLLHIRPDEIQGLSSMLTVTILILQQVCQKYF